MRNGTGLDGIGGCANMFRAEISAVLKTVHWVKRLVTFTEPTETGLRSEILKYELPNGKETYCKCSAR